MRESSESPKRSRKVFVLPEDVDDPQGFGASWAIQQSGATDAATAEKMASLWWGLYKSATREAAESARFEVRETSRIGTPENRQLEAEISGNPDFELVGPDSLDMNRIFEETKWRFGIAFASYVNARKV